MILKLESDSIRGSKLLPTIILSYYYLYNGIQKSIGIDFSISKKKKKKKKKEPVHFVGRKTNKHPNLVALTNSSIPLSKNSQQGNN